MIDKHIGRTHYYRTDRLTISQKDSGLGIHSFALVALKKMPMSELLEFLFK